MAKNFLSNIIIDLSTIWVSIYSFKCFKTVWSWLFTSTLFLPCSYRLEVWNGMLLKFLHILITAIYSKDRKWIFKTVNCISCSVVCKIDFCSEFPDILDNAGQVTRRTRRRRRRRTQAIAKGYAFHANAVTAEFASNSTANIKLSKRPSFLLLTSNKYITKSKNVAAKKIMWWSSCSKNTQKTNLWRLILQCCRL